MVTTGAAVLALPPNTCASAGSPKPEPSRVTAYRLPVAAGLTMTWVELSEPRFELTTTDTVIGLLPEFLSRST
jgi:hypothetical protein